MVKDELHRAGRKSYLGLQSFMRIAGANRVINFYGIGPTILRSSPYMDANRIIGKISTAEDIPTTNELLTKLALSVHHTNSGIRPLRLHRQARLMEKGLLAAGNNTRIDGSRFAAQAEEVVRLEKTPFRRLLSRCF